jgi:hypothetical protein
LKEDTRHIRCKIQTLDHGHIELASVAGQKSSDWRGTDAGFALSRFLDYARSLSNSPTPSLNAPPIILPLDPESEIGNSTGLLLSKPYLNESDGPDDTPSPTIDKPEGHDSSIQTRD